MQRVRVRLGVRVTSLQTKVQVLENNNKDLEEKNLDLETRSRRFNLRLVGLQEGADALELSRTNRTMERATRTGPRIRNTSSPRRLIMKFLNYRDKEMDVRAAKTKREVLYKKQPLRLYQDMTAGVHKKQKDGIIPPARLIVTHQERSHIFYNRGG